MKKKIIFCGLTLLFSFSAVSGLFSGNVAGAVGCLLIAAICGFLAYRSFKSSDSAISATAGVKSANNTAPPPENSDNLATPPTSVSSTPISAPKNEFEFVAIKLSGVTFKNENGALRQSILRKINFHDAPFDEYIELELQPYEFEGSPAYGVYANGLQIGNIPADKVQFVSDNWEHIDSVSAIDVYGGGHGKDGQAISYGCKITLKLRNK